MGLFYRSKKQEAVERSAPTISDVKQASIHRVSKQRLFQAAEVNDALASWTTSTVTPDELVFKSLRVLRARSRQLMVATDFAPAFIRLCENHIIGNTGFRFCGKARDGEDLDKKANSALERAWRKWGKGKACDFKGKHNQVSFDKLVIRTVAVDGEAFIQELNNKNGQASFRIYDPEMVPIEYNVARANNQNLIRFGIEYDSNDRPVAYHFRDQNGKIAFQGGYSGNALKMTRIPADLINHVYVQDRVDLRRGFPWMSASMVRVRMLQKLEDSAVQNAIAGATNFGIISGDGSDEVMTSMEDNGDKVIETEGINLYETPHEVDFSSFDSKFPDADFPAFVKSNIRSLASGLGVNYNTLSGDLDGVNFSSLKHGTTEERESWKSLQDWFVQDWKDDQKNRWLKRELLLGIPLPSGKNLPVDKFEKFSEVEFFGRRWVGPDPLKESTASLMQMKSNTISPQRVMMEKGLNPDEVIEEISEFHAKMRELGIPVEVGANVINLNMGDEDASKESKN